MRNSKASSASQHESHNLILMLDLLAYFLWVHSIGKIEGFIIVIIIVSICFGNWKASKKDGGKETFLELKGNLVKDFSMFSWTYCLAYETQKRDTEAFEKRGESLGQIFAIVQKVGFRTLIPLEKQGRKESITTDFFSVSCMTAFPFPMQKCCSDAFCDG